MRSSPEGALWIAEGGVAILSSPEGALWIVFHVGVVGGLAIRSSPEGALRRARGLAIFGLTGRCCVCILHTGMMLCPPACDVWFY
jgi:hypothetical protein